MGLTRLLSSKAAWVAAIIVAVSLSGVMLGTQSAVAFDDDGTACKYDLNASGDGTVTLKINPNRVQVEIRGALSNTLYTVWTDFRNRAPVKELAADHPGLVLARRVAPTFATVAGVTSGMGLDLNGVITNGKGNATLNIRLDYNLLETGASPVVAADLVEQGPERLVGGGWMRQYDDATNRQLVDAEGLPELVRATAQGITMVGHVDNLTHGHTPGTDIVDRFSGFSGDFPSSCSGS